MSRRIHAQRIIVACLAAVSVAICSACSNRPAIGYTESPDSNEAVQSNPAKTALIEFDDYKPGNANSFIWHSLSLGANIAHSTQIQNEAMRHVFIDNFEALSQFPELPTGCEVTTLTAVLNYLGIDIDKETLADDYLKKAPVGLADYNSEFVGNPRSKDSFGCYAQVIVDCACNYAASTAAPVDAKNLTGISLEDVKGLVASGNPVIVWTTRRCEPGEFTTAWTVNGRMLRWFAPEHCVAVLGYDRESKLIWVADSLDASITSYNEDVFEKSYESLGRQAVLLTRT